MADFRCRTAWLEAELLRATPPFFITLDAAESDFR